MLANLGFDYSRALLWIVLLPLAGALVNGVSGRFASRGLVRAIAVGSVGAAFLLALACFLEISVGAPAPAEGEEAEAARLLTVVYDWFTVKLGDATIPVRVAFLMDNLSGVMTLVVTGIGLLITSTRRSTMIDDAGYAGSSHTSTSSRRACSSSCSPRTSP